jgi:predicted DNA repair protein MutK
MAFSGLIALLDDVATIADDVAAFTMLAAKKTSGVVTDDMAVTAEQAMGIQREREIPVVLAVAWGSLKNKALILAPGALFLNAIAPWSITPILMAGGTFLAFEGVEKIVHKLRPHEEEHHEAEDLPTDPVAFERARVAGAIRTDLILSGEIIALSLGEVAAEPFLTQVGVLYAVSVVLTVGVYGVVIGLVKIDDAGEAMVRASSATAWLGRLIIRAAPLLLRAITWIGTFAMLMVGGHIILHGIHPLAEAVHHLVETLPEAARGLAGLVADVLVGAVVGSIVVGAMATGIPGRLWAMVPKPQRKK